MTKYVAFSRHHALALVTNRLAYARRFSSGKWRRWKTKTLLNYAQRFGDVVFVPYLPRWVRGEWLYGTLEEFRKFLAERGVNARKTLELFEKLPGMPHPVPARLKQPEPEVVRFRRISYIRYSRFKYEYYVPKPQTIVFTHDKSHFVAVYSRTVWFGRALDGAGEEWSIVSVLKEKLLDHVDEVPEQCIPLLLKIARWLPDDVKDVIAALR